MIGFSEQRTNKKTTRKGGLFFILNGYLMYGKRETCLRIEIPTTESNSVTPVNADLEYNNPSWLETLAASKITGVMGIAQGETGQATASAAINALLPDQEDNSGFVLGSDGEAASWVIGPSSWLNAAIASDEDDWNPGVARNYRVSSDAVRSITGLNIGQLGGQECYFYNVGTHEVILKHENTDSTNGNRSVIALCGVTVPQNSNSNTVHTGYIDMRTFSEVMFVFSFGAIDSTNEIYIRESTDTSDGGGQTLKTAVSMTGNDDSKQVVVNVKASELSEGYRYLRGRCTTGSGTTSFTSCVVFGRRSGWAAFDASEDLSSIAQIVG